MQEQRFVDRHQLTAFRRTNAKQQSVKGIASLRFYPNVRKDVPLNDVQDIDLQRTQHGAEFWRLHDLLQFANPGFD